MSEDVSKFLEQVKELGERRVPEDEARARELEEKIIKDKQERQARRRERARSISPEKSSPTHTPPTSAQRLSKGSQHLNLEGSPVLEPPLTGSPRALPSRPLNDEMASTSPTKENEAPSDFGSNSKQGGQTSPTRSGSVARGLTWQRRPPSQHGPRSRPLSMVATENAARSSTTPQEPVSASAEIFSRAEIASALSAKDPTWFKQTPDRGANSAAYRKNQVEDEHRSDIFAATPQLAGMGRERPQSVDFRSLGSPAFSRGAPSPLPMSASAPKLDPPSTDSQSDIQDEEQPLKSPPQLGRTSPTRTDRPVSPTKGMGGFVQSAMMKRSDSVNKRWSVKSPTGLQRSDSVVANRGAQEPALRTGLGGGEHSQSLSRDASAEPSSRPTSSRGFDKSFDSEAAPPKMDTTPKASSKSPELRGEEAEPEALPVSPSKTMDPRRWSPTKSSWLEAALNKPESPKPKNPAAAQPSWMADLQKAKAEKATNPGSESPRPAGAGHKHQVSIGGLMRGPALGQTTKPTTLAMRPVATGGMSVRERAATLGKSSQPSVTTPKESRPTLEHKGDEQAEPQAAPELIKEKAAPSETQSPIVKPKPDIPPKQDFRDPLKHRQTPSTTNAGGSEPEFKNVFGNLRRTQTKNYKAPDELKDNILKGKAGLTQTGGPKKTERVDEFKESILAKKKSFHEAQREGRGVTRNDSSASETPIPEALLRSRALSRGANARPTRAEKSVGPPTSSTPTEAERPDPALGRETSSIAETTASPSPVIPSLQKEASAPGRLQGKVGGSALANRFNPALAGFLARGPPGSGSSGAGPVAKTTSPAAEINDNQAGSGPKLTHMTKGRARGPKRKAPTSSSTAAPAISAAEVAPTAKPDGLESESVKQVASPAAAEEPQYENRPMSTKAIASTMDKAPAGARNIFNQVAAAAVQKTQQPATSPKAEEPVEADAPPSPRKLNMNRMSKFLDNSAPASPKLPESKPLKETRLPSAGSPVIKPKPSFDRPSSVASERSQPPIKPKPSFEALSSPAFQTSQPSSPVVNKPARPLPEPRTFHDPELRVEPLSISKSPSPRPLGARPLPTTPARELPSRPLPSPSKMSSSMAASPLPSPKKQADELTVLLQDFFGPRQADRNYRADAAGLLMERPNAIAPKMKTLAAHMFQFSADGRKQVLPSHREHTLFDQEMYLCSHTFESDAGWKVTEVYFWAGDEVPQSTVEDASIFVGREAKQLGGNLVNIQQGRETPGFIQALGGIVVIQRGNGNKHDSLAPHMFCGRRYLGQVVFDEVDFTPTTLCSGFPYLVTTGGKCFLWKGKGSNVDELSCARLIGMDYALTGEIEEIEDGQEPESFWNLFESGSKLGSADHWRLKPNYDKYGCRLFYSNATVKQQVIEVSPFSQKDLQSSGIYVLDAFFELYIIVGSHAQSQYASFHNALEFAQEYAILAAGMEDRPFVPVSSVVLEGAPRDFKSVFRKWRDADSPTVMPALMQPAAGSGLKRGRSMRVVTLNQALQALNE